MTNNDDSTRAPGDREKPAVLVVDDSPLVHRLLRARLRDEPIELVHATTAEEGLAAVRGRPIATVLLDLSMPGMDGFELLRVLTEEPGATHVPVIVLSGQQNSQDKVAAFGLGAMDYITKPFDLAELRARLRSALRINRLVTMLSERAQIDGLTGLWNRAHFEERLAQAVATNQRHDRPLSIAMLDIDHFKSINDNYGHPAGDSAIQGVADVLQQAGRKGDVACRYGGEEFALIMPDTTPDQAQAMCERIRESIEQRRWPSHPDRALTISAGVCGSTAAAPAQPTDWVSAADGALYDSKQAGRNRVTVRHMDGTRPALARAS